MTSENNFNPVGWFEIYVEDMERSRRFYETVFQCKLEKMESPDETELWSFPSDMSVYGAAGALVKMPGFPVGRNSVLIYFSCSDCGALEESVKKAGGSIEKSRFSIGEYGFISLVYDTEGNMIGLHSMD